MRVFYSSENAKHKKTQKNTSPFYGVQHQTWRTKQDPTAPLICALAGSAAAFNAMGQSQRKEVKNEGADARFTKKRPLSHNQASCTNSIPKNEIVTTYHENMPKKVNFANFFITFFYLCTKIC